MFDGFDTLQEVSISNDIYSLHINSFGDPHSLTDAEAMKYCDWLALAMHQYGKQMAMQQLDLMPFDTVDHIRGSFDFYFSSHLSRYCYEGAIKPWLGSELTEAIDREMEAKPPLASFPGMQ